MLKLSYHRYRLFLITGLLLIIAASRFTRLSDIDMELDEVWSIWQTFGTPQQIVQWTPYDWTPTYYLVLGAWKELVGIHPEALRALSVFVFLPGCAFVYHLMRQLQGERAALLAMLTYAALGYGIFLSLQVRAYTFVYMLMPLALWLTHRYFDHPTLRRAVAFAICLLAMFYFYLPSALGFVMLGVYTVIVYRKQVWRWWLPGMLAFVPALPEIAAKFSLVVTRTEATQQLPTAPLLDTVGSLFQAYTGDTFYLWIALFVLAVGMIVYQRKFTRRTAALLVWALLGPVLVYFLNPLLGFLREPRYSFWVILGIVLLVAWGLAYLPRLGVMLAAAILVVMLFVPLPINNYQYIAWPMAARFDWLRDHIRWGDVIVVDPHCDCPSPETWDYFLRVYFPDGGLEFVNDPADYRRVWYVISERDEDPELAQTVEENRMYFGLFSGSPGFMFRLYEAPPDIEGILFDNGMRFHGFDIIEDGIPQAGVLVKREGEPVRVRLWWSADGPIEFDYSVGLYLVRDVDQLTVDQVDGPPQVTDGPQETSQWRTGRYYVEERELTLPYPLSNRTHTIYLAVYQWWDSVRIAAPGVDDNTLLPLRSVHVTTW
jgi:hypothetical protein